MRKLGANYLGDGFCEFCVWAPLKDNMELHIAGDGGETVMMNKDDEGYFTISLGGISAGTKYFFKPNGSGDYPDPASHYQPEDVHGPSSVVDHKSYKWNDDKWKGIAFKDLILYELHTGTFTQEGTFEAIIYKLDDLTETGINAIELMPVAQFPGDRNWGYDGVFPYAVQHSYGGPEGLKKLVDACHQRGVAVFLDVVYNHMGPEGNYLQQYGPYFTSKYHVPWGDAINLDGEWCDGVREYFINNALYWFEHYHIDGLRLDAVHEMYDNGSISFWQLLHNEVELLQQRVGRPLYLTAESDYNSPRAIKHPDNGGMGFTAQWLDDFHHALYVIIDKNGRDRYYDYGSMEQLAKAYNDGFVLSGEYVKFRKKKHGASSAGVPGDKFIAFNHNHDQVGNRVKGERLSVLVDEDRQKLAAAALLLSPYVPLLFMGEEYGEDAPFFFFISHHDQELVKVVQEGRKREFEAFGSFDAPDPYSVETFNVCKLRWEKRNEGKHRDLLQWHRQLIEMRKTHPSLQTFDKNNCKAHPLDQSGLVLHRQCERGINHLFAVFNFSDEAITCTMPLNKGEWKLLLTNKQQQWHGQTFAATAEISVPPTSLLVFD